MALSGELEIILLCFVLRTEVPSSNSSTERNSTQFYEKESRRVRGACSVSHNFFFTLANHHIEI